MAPGDARRPGAAISPQRRGHVPVGFRVGIGPPLRLHLLCPDRPALEPSPFAASHAGPGRVSSCREGRPACPTPRKGADVDVDTSTIIPICPGRVADLGTPLRRLRDRRGLGQRPGAGPLSTQPTPFAHNPPALALARAGGVAHQLPTPLPRGVGDGRHAFGRLRQGRVVGLELASRLARDPAPVVPGDLGVRRPDRHRRYRRRDRARGSPALPRTRPDPGLDRRRRKQRPAPVARQHHHARTRRPPRPAPADPQRGARRNVASSSQTRTRPRPFRRL